MAKDELCKDSVDNVDHMNAFLALIGGEQVNEDYFDRPAHVAQPQLAADRDEAVPSKSQPSSGESTNASTSPVNGTRAPPTTPATGATAIEKVANMKLDPIDEHDPIILTKLADPCTSLQDSMYARNQRHLYTGMPSPKPSQNLSSISLALNRLDEDRPLIRTKAQQDIIDRISKRQSPFPATKCATEVRATCQSPPTSFAFEDAVLANFRGQAGEKERNKENVKEAQNTEPFPPYDDSQCFEEYCDKIEIMPTSSGPGSTSSLHILNLTPKVEFLSPKAPDFTPSLPNAISSSEQAAGRLAPKDSPEVPGEASAMAKSPQAVLDQAKAELVARTGRLSISVKEPGSPESPSIVITASEDPVDRESATHFTSWGGPQARNTSRARARKIILRGLPATADLTLVQGLVHGGAIDNYNLGINGTASVTFTTADSCDAYYAKYPNGITSKFKGRNSVVYVEKGSDVDVISGMLRGQLECGASRCVRATGADEDWGMKALIKLAEGQTRKGKVENISDIWRNEVRTIVFRFTSIHDAVSFKAMLTRDNDWEACNIQFMDDPCETATGVHLE